MSEFLPLDTRTGKVRSTSSDVGTEDKPIDFTDVFVIGILGGGEISGITPLVNGQSYIDVWFPAAQPAADWTFLECRVVNTVDVSPLNIWPGIVTSKTTTGFRLQLNGTPDSANYILSWTIKGTSTVPLAPATTYSLSGPVTGPISAPATFTVSLPTGTSVTTPVTVTPSDGGAGGTFAPTTVTLTTALLPATFTYTPASYGAKTISVTNDGGLANPASRTFTSVTATYLFSGPSGGAISVPSTNFTVALPAGGAVLGTVTVTPHDGGAGTFTPTTVALTTAAPSAMFTYTPVSTGTKTISVTNNHGLTDPGSLSYAVTGPLSDGDPVSSWNDSSGNGHTATQTGSLRPIFKTAIVNGKPVVRFTSAASQRLTLASSISAAAPWTAFIVMKVTTAPMTGLAASGGTVVTAPTLSAGILYFGDRTHYWDVAYALTGFHVLTGLVVTPGTEYILIDGTSASIATASFGPAADFDTIGARLSVPDYSDGDIAEIIIYNVAVSTDRANIEKYLGTKYGITVAGGSAVDPSTVTGLVGWWKADSL